MLKRLLRNERQQFAFEENLPSGVHYIELWADRRPTVHALKLDIGEITDVTQPDAEEPEEGEEKRIPTVDDPKWAGNFADDTEIMLLARLILGEAESESRETKIWVGSSVLNRVKAQTWWGTTVHDVILKPGQYDPFTPNNKRHSVITDPLQNAASRTAAAWRESYEIAEGLLSGIISIPTEATHFHGIGVTRDWFIENVVPEGRFLRHIDNTHLYWSPN